MKVLLWFPAICIFILAVLSLILPVSHPIQNHECFTYLNKTFWPEVTGLIAGLLPHLGMKT